MRKLVLASLIVAGTSFAESFPQPQVPTQPSAIPQPTSSQLQPQPMPPQPQTSPNQIPTPTPQANSIPSNSIPNSIPVEIKPEDRAIINLKKKMMIKQVYNDYQKTDKATSIDRINLEKSLREAKYALKSQIYKEKQLDSQLPYPYYYSIPIAGVVGNMVLTNQTVLKDGSLLKGKDKISVRDGLVYVGDYLISYPIMDNIKQPKVDTNITSSSPQLLTGLPTANLSDRIGSPIGSPPMPLPPPR